MKVTAIVSEYNPLHTGHILHMEKARNETGADHLIAVMSGDYVQRGCPAIISKYERARYALMGGADLVLELPLYYSTGSIEYFSLGAVSLIQKTGLVNCISFGSECGDIDTLKKAAALTGNMSADKEKRLKELLAGGISYSNAINTVCDLPDDIKEVLKTPNNLLAVAYIRAAHTLGFDCDFHTVKRTGSPYHDDSAGALSSTSIRKEILSYSDELNGDSGLHNVLSGRMPSEISDLFLSFLKENAPLSEDDLSMLLFYKINSCTVQMLNAYLDVTESLASKIMNKYKHASDFSQLCANLKSKDLNYARISRALLHIILDIRKDYIEEYRADGYNYYIKPLAFKGEAQKLMHNLKDASCLPLLSKNADAANILSGHGLRMFNEGIKASDLYNKTACTLCKRPFKSEYEYSATII